MLHRWFRKKSFYHRKISRLNRDLKTVGSEIRGLENELARLRKASSVQERKGPFSPLPGPRGKIPADSESRKRFASYLSTGSFQTIRAYKFKSDFIRRRRLMWGIILVSLLAISILLWKIL